MSFFKSLGRAIARVWHAPEVKEVRHDLELAAKAVVQREINEILLRNLGGPVAASLVRTLIAIDRLADSDPVAAAAELAALKSQLERKEHPHG